MRALLMITVIFACIVLSLSAVGGVIYLFIRLLQGGISAEARMIRSQEAGMIQEIYQGLARMEERVEALETILLDKEQNRERERKQKEEENDETLPR